MSTFNVHEWNRKRRLDSLDEAIPGPADLFKESKLHDLQDAIDEASKAGALTQMEKFAFDELLKRAIKRRARDRGDLDELSSKNLNEVEPQTNLIGIAAHALKDMNTEEAIDAIDRLMLYLKDAKADIEYKSY